MIIRRTEPEDAGKLMLLWQSVFDDPTEDMFPFFRTVFPVCDGYCAEEDGAVTGMVFAVPCEIAAGKRRFVCRYLYALGVAEDRRGQGIGKALLSAVKDDCLRNGADALLVLPSEESLFDYYAAEGYAVWAWANGCSLAAGEQAAVQEVDTEAYLSARKAYLEPSGAAYVIPSAAVASLSRCFVWDGGCCAADRTDGEWFVQELCGSAAGVPTAAMRLGVRRLSIIRSNGGYPYAMAMALNKDFPKDGLWSFGME